MAEPREKLDNEISALWLKYRPLNLERFTALVSVAIALRSGILTTETRERGRNEAHKIAGAAASFGFADISTLAQELETRLTGEDLLNTLEFENLLQQLAKRFGFDYSS
jgi:HPt (histidine-containing phosphotransfer) domain-containing protein